MTYEWPLMSPEDQCEACNNRCIHGVCDCSAEMCVDCWRKWNLEKEAEREANWQRNVMGPLLGFDKEAVCPKCELPQSNNGSIAWCEKGHVFDLETHVHDWRGIDTGRMCAICCKTEEL